MNKELINNYSCDCCGRGLENGKKLFEDRVVRIIICDCCGNRKVLPKENQTQEVLDYLFSGQRNLLQGKFEEAYIDFKEASKRDETEHEAYFGMALSEQKIRYVENVADETEKKPQPLCYKVDQRSFKENKNYKLACEYASEIQRKEYEEKAKEIDIIKTEFAKLEKLGVEYDCFFCAKKEDYDMVREQYILLNRWYKIFFAEPELYGKEGCFYEAAILYALYKAKSMIIFCSNEGYLRTPWVRNECQRYIEFMEEGSKNPESLTIVYKDEVIEKLPLENYKNKLQAINYSENPAYFIKNFIDRHKYNFFNIMSNLDFVAKIEKRSKTYKTIRVVEYPMFFLLSLLFCLSLHITIQDIQLPLNILNVTFARTIFCIFIGIIDVVLLIKLLVQPGTRNIEKQCKLKLYRSICIEYTKNILNEMRERYSIENENMYKQLILKIKKCKSLTKLENFRSYAYGNKIGIDGDNRKEEIPKIKTYIEELAEKLK